MLCTKCGYDNAEQAVYCIHCGHRLDGQITCPHCKTLNPEEAKFCMACGKSLAEDAQPAEESIPAPAPQAQDKKKADWRKILKFCGGGSAMLGILFTLIFVFCIGFRARAIGDASQTGIVSSSEFFYVYFGKVYANIAKTLSGLGNVTLKKSIYLATDGYVNAILGTLASAAVIVCVLTFSGIAIYRFVLFCKGKKTKSYFRPAATAYFSFLVGSCSLLALNQMSISYSGVSASVTLNGATVAGAVLGAIFLFVGIALNLATKGKELLNKERLCNYITSVVGLDLIFVLLIFFPLAGIKATDSGVSLAAGTSYWMQLLAIEYISDGITAPIAQSILAIVTRVVQLVSILLVGILAVRFTRNLLRKNSKKVLSVAIPALIFSAAYLVLTVLFSQLCKVPLEMEETAFSYAPAIVCFVFTLFALAASIVNTVLGKAKKPTKKSPPQTQEPQKNTEEPKNDAELPQNNLEESQSDTEEPQSDAV